MHAFNIHTHAHIHNEHFTDTIAMNVFISYILYYIHLVDMNAFANANANPIYLSIEIYLSI